MTSPSPGSCRGGSGRPGEATVATGAALTTTTRRTPVARIASTMASVPREATPASARDRGPSPDSTASAPATAGSRAAGPAVARSAVTARTSAGRVAGFRTTAVTSWPAARAWSSSWPADPAGGREDGELHLPLPGTLLPASQNVWRPYYMSSRPTSGAGDARGRRRAANAIKESMRELSIQLSLLNHQVGAHLELRDIDLELPRHHRPPRPAQPERPGPEGRPPPGHGHRHPRPPGARRLGRP